MCLAKRNHEIQTLAAHGSDQPFAVGVRLRGPRGSAQHSQPEGLELFVDFRREDRVAVAKQKSVGVIAGNGLPELLQGPFCRRVCRDVAVHDSPCSDFHDQEDIEHSEPSRHDDQEIARHDGLARDCGRKSSSVARTFFAALVAPAREANRPGRCAGKHRFRVSPTARPPLGPVPRWDSPGPSGR